MWSLLVLGEGWRSSANMYSKSAIQRPEGGTTRAEVKLIYGITPNIKTDPDPHWRTESSS